MSRRNPGSSPAPIPKPGSSPKARPVASARPEAGEEGDGSDPDVVFVRWLGERLRRVALGATAALLTARAFWTSEPDLTADAVGGLVWVLAILAVAGLALAGALAGGNLRFRWSWADAAVIALIGLVGVSAGHAVDRRLAINLAWEWGGLGVAYLLVRNLPRTRGESTALAGALAATAVAVAVYGLYQVGVELPEVQRKFLANRAEALRMLQIAPGSAAEKLFENRLLGSNEPFSTFALANSLAGFLVGPLVVMLSVWWDNLTRREGRGARAGALVLALPPLLAVLVCLTLTKSRSAYIGLAVALLVLAWRERRRVRARTLALAAAVAALVVVGLVAAGLATGRLDPLVLTQSGKSLRYRQEYWVGAWRAINESRRAFWSGFGPGNFVAPYLRHKLPQASEEIRDPHNFVLEVWSTAGVWAVVALAAAVVLGVGNALRPAAKSEDDEFTEPPPKASKTPPDPWAPPRSPAWLVVSAACGWLAVILLGRIDPITEFERWMVLGGAWVLAAACGLALWRRRPLDAGALGAASLAVLVNLSAAGGISIPTVALALWTLVAVGQNLRDDLPCGRLRGPIGRLPAFGLAAVWAAMLGTFAGAVTPSWKADAAIAEADEALLARPPDYDRAEAAYYRAIDADRLSARPWLGLAALEYQGWMARGGSFEDERWKRIPVEMFKAVSGDRPADSWSRHRERARMTSLLLKQLGDKLSPKEATKLRADVVQASRTAALLYPTNASLRAWLAEASADIGMFPDALGEGREALRLDRLTPHEDKKLEPAIRQWLESKVPEWEKAVARANDTAKPPSKPKGR
jgi:O-antigen ligase